MADPLYVSLASLWRREPRVALEARASRRSGGASLTRKVSLPELPAALLSAIEKHAADASIQLVDVHAWCTHRTNPPSTSFFGKLFGKRSNSADADTEHEMVLVLQRTHVLVGTHGASRGTAVLSLPLLQATITRGSKLVGALAGLASRADLPTDDGITIDGFPGTEGRPGSYFFGMGGAEADACFEAVREAVLRAKNPR